MEFIQEEEEDAQRIDIPAVILPFSPSMNNTNTQQLIENAKYARYEEAELLRSNLPKTSVTQLDLSYCKGLRDKDLKLLVQQCSTMELDMIDLSGCQEGITISELTRFLHHFGSITKLKLHDWKLDAMYIKLLISHHKIAYLGVSAMHVAESSVETPLSYLNLYYLLEDSWRSRTLKTIVRSKNLLWQLQGLTFWPQATQ